MSAPSPLDLQLALVEAADTRASRVHAVALLSLPLAVLARWPSLFSPLAARAALVTWLLAALSAAWAFVQELRLVLRLARASPERPLYEGPHVPRGEEPPAA